MCNTVLSPVNCLENFSIEDTSLNLRRCRSFGDLALHDTFASALPNSGSNGGLRRRTSSLEDLVSFASRHREENRPTMELDPCIEEHSSEELNPSPRQTNGISKAEQSTPESTPYTFAPTSTSAFAQHNNHLPPFNTITNNISAADSPRSTSGYSSPQAPLSARNSLDIEPRKSSDLGPVGRTTGHLADGHAAEELFYRLNHARQTIDYVKRQAATFSTLQKGTMDIWQALDTLNTLREYEAALLGDDSCDPDMSLLEHAMQTAELCRLTFPEHDWMALVGLLHGLGKLLAHASFGAEPQWAVCGESFPVGCRFHPAILHSQYFQANPDRRRRMYATPTGIYQPNCGLNSVCMSWSGPEYLFMVLAMNRTKLPAEALFLLRHQKFAALLRPGQPYYELLSNFDRSMLPMLSKFRELIQYKRREVPNALQGEEFHSYYEGLIEKYIPQKQLKW